MSTTELPREMSKKEEAAYERERNGLPTSAKTIIFTNTYKQWMVNPNSTVGYSWIIPACNAIFHACSCADTCVYGLDGSTTAAFGTTTAATHHVDISYIARIELPNGGFGCTPKPQYSHHRTQRIRQHHIGQGPVCGAEAYCTSLRSPQRCYRAWQVVGWWEMWKAFFLLFVSFYTPYEVKTP